MKSGFATHLQHFHVFVQDETFNPLEPIRLRIVDKTMKHGPAEALPLEITAHEQRIFGRLMIRIAR